MITSTPTEAIGHTFGFYKHIEILFTSANIAELLRFFKTIFGEVFKKINIFKKFEVSAIQHA